MLGQRRRRWTNIGPTFFQWIVFAGNLLVEEKWREQLIIYDLCVLKLELFPFENQFCNKLDLNINLRVSTC